MSVYFEFAEVLDFTVGAVGEPGQRTFYLQASDDERVVAVKCEKQQVAAIAQYLRRILGDLQPAPGPTSVTASTISEPLVAAFTLGSIGLGFDPDSDQFVVQLDELVPGDLDDDAQDEDDEEPGTPLAGGATSGEAEVDRGRVRVRITAAQALAFCQRAEQVVAAGRPGCIFCGLPIDPDGHHCPRMN